LKTEYLNNKVLESNIASFKNAKQNKCKYEFIIEDLSRSASVRDLSDEKHNLLSRKKQEYNKVMSDFNASQAQLAVAFLTLAQNIIRYRKFHFVDTDDAVQEFAMICLEKIEYFDPVKGKAFNYMTTCILNHYRQLYRSARNYNELKKKFGDHLQSKVRPGRKVKKPANQNRDRDFNQ
jgi:hypothetical protein